MRLPSRSSASQPFAAGRSRTPLPFEFVDVSSAVLRVLDPGESELTLFPTRSRVALFLKGGHACAVAGQLFTLGRSLDNSAVLLDPAVSREHAYFLHENGSWRAVNVSAHAPLWIGERRLETGEDGPLLPGDVLRLGQSAIQFLAPISTSLPDTSLPDETDPGATVAAPDAHEPAPVSAARPSARGEGRKESSTHVFGLGVTLEFALRPPRGGRAAVAAAAFAAVALTLALACAVITLGAASLIGADALAAYGLGRVLAALAIPLAPTLGAGLLVALLDRYEREPPLVLLGAFLWGALIAIPPALLAERAITQLLLSGVTAAGLPADLTRALIRALSAGLVEESVKGAGLLLLLLAIRDEFDNLTDGVLYGLLIGAGFALVENYTYFAQSPRADLPFLIAGRVCLGWLSHSTFTALFGAGLGFARETRSRPSRWLLPLLGFCGAVLCHTAFDFTTYAADALAAARAVSSPALLVGGALVLTYLPLFGEQATLLAILVAALRREAAIIREFLAGEVSAGSVTPDEYALLQHAALRARAERRLLFALGLRAYLTARALHQTAIGLAFRAWHVANGDPAKAGALQPEDAYRARLARLRASLARQLATYGAGEVQP